MQQWVKDEVRKVAWELKEEGFPPYDGYIVNPLAVYGRMSKTNSRALKHMRRYLKGDPYQELKAWVPRTA